MNALAFSPIAHAEAVARLGTMPPFLSAALASAAGEDLARQPAPGVFSLVEHACHLRDLEIEGYRVRVERMLCEREPALAPFDGGAIAATRDYPRQDAFAAARELSATRGEVIARIAALTPAELAREGTFDGRRVCLADVIAMILEHDRGHREEIEALLAGTGR